MIRPELLQGVYRSGNRELHYWTRCEHCAERPQCVRRRAPIADCDTVGWMRFVVDGRRLVYWSGIIDQRKIDRTVQDYLENDPPPDVAMTARMVQGRLL